MNLNCRNHSTTILGPSFNYSQSWTFGSPPIELGKTLTQKQIIFTCIQSISTGFYFCHWIFQAIICKPKSNDKITRFWLLLNAKSQFLMFISNQGPRKSHVLGVRHKSCLSLLWLSFHHVLRQLNKQLGDCHESF